MGLTQSSRAQARPGQVDSAAGSARGICGIPTNDMHQFGSDSDGMVYSCRIVVARLSSYLKALAKASGASLQATKRAHLPQQLDQGAECHSSAGNSFLLCTGEDVRAAP
jgi:hypothetical protein